MRLACVYFIVRFLETACTKVQDENWSQRARVMMTNYLVLWNSVGKVPNVVLAGAVPADLWRVWQTSLDGLNRDLVSRYEDRKALERGVQGRRDTGLLRAVDNDKAPELSEVDGGAYATRNSETKSKDESKDAFDLGALRRKQKQLLREREEMKQLEDSKEANARKRASTDDDSDGFVEDYGDEDRVLW
jgi:hypothetical protein